jgi:hypothetical protein
MHALCSIDCIISMRSLFNSTRNNNRAADVVCWCPQRLIESGVLTLKPRERRVVSSIMYIELVSDPWRPSRRLQTIQYLHSNTHSSINLVKEQHRTAASL